MRLLAHSTRTSEDRYAILLNAAFNLASASFESEVFKTLGLYGSISGRTLSSVTLLTSTKSADDPGGIVLPSFFIKSSLMPKSTSDPDSAPAPAPATMPTAIPTSGLRKRMPTKVPHNAPRRDPVAAPTAVRLTACLR